MSIRLMMKKTNAREKYGNPSMAMSAAVLSGLTNKPTRICGNKINAAVVTMPQTTEVNNAIRFETAVIEANEAKIKANLLMMNSSYQSYRISASQIYANWKASK